MAALRKRIPLSQEAVRYEAQMVDHDLLMSVVASESNIVHLVGSAVDTSLEARRRVDAWESVWGPPVKVAERKPVIVK